MRTRAISRREIIFTRKEKREREERDGVGVGGRKGRRGASEARRRREGEDMRYNRRTVAGQWWTTCGACRRDL